MRDADKRKQEAVIKAGNAYKCYTFAKDVQGADVTALLRMDKM